MDPIISQNEADKQRAAASSVVAAVGLTTLKLVVGLSTDSLGILAEAAHSGLDLAAAVMTLFAVRIAGRPADRQHLYGHGKVENLSALFEALLLLATCAWIIWEASHRLLGAGPEIEVNIWSYLVMGTSIIVDISRTRVLSAAAKRHKSQALEADALHFSTDIWSSCVVILGLACVQLSERYPKIAILRQADSVAAIIVALICLAVIYQLGRRTVDALMDQAPEGIVELVKSAAEQVPGVLDCHDIRVRSSGPRLFIDAHVLVDGNQTLRAAHELTDLVEQAIRSAVPSADVLVHAEPAD